MVLEQLLPGKENKKTSAELIRALHLRSTRDLTEVVRVERLHGAPILSTKSAGGGYYLPANMEETKAFIGKYSQEARAILEMCKAIEELAGIDES